MLIGLITNVSGRSQFLLEDVVDFKFFLNFQLLESASGSRVWLKQKAIFF
jgi:hypothetical protein